MKGCHWRDEGFKPPKLSKYSSTDFRGTTERGRKLETRLCVVSKSNEAKLPKHVYIHENCRFDKTQS